MMKTAIIIVNYRTPWHLDLCLGSVFKHTTDFHLFLVQNSPDTESLKVGEKYKSQFPDQITIIVNEQNQGYVGGVNSAYTEAMNYERVCFVNSDIIVTVGWLKELNGVFDRFSDVVQVCPDTNNHYPEKKFWRIVQKLPFGLSKLYQHRVNYNPPRAQDANADFSEVSSFYYFPGGYCNLVRSEFFKELGYFLDPNIIHGYWDDFDLAYYLRQFGRVGSIPRSYVFHFLNASFNKVNENKAGMKQSLMQLNGLYVMDKWRDRLKQDLAQINNEQLLTDVRTSHVLQTVINYLGLVEAKPELQEYIRSIPAREIGAEFLK